MLMDVIGHMIVFPHQLAGVIQCEGLNVRAGAPVDVDALGIDEGGTAGKGVVGLVDLMRDELLLMSPQFFAILTREGDDSALV